MPRIGCGLGPPLSSILTLGSIKTLVNLMVLMMEVLMTALIRQKALERQLSGMLSILAKAVPSLQDLCLLVLVQFFAMS